MTFVGEATVKIFCFLCQWQFTRERATFNSFHSEKNPFPSGLTKKGGKEDVNKVVSTVTTDKNVRT